MIEIQQAQFWLGVIGLVITGITATSIAVYTIMNKIDDDRAKQDEKIEETRKTAEKKAEDIRDAVEDKLSDKVRERNEKIEGIGKSFDKHREEAFKLFVLKESCGIMHLQNKEEIARIERENKESRHELRDMIQSMNLKLDAINKAVMEIQAGK